MLSYMQATRWPFGALLLFGRPLNGGVWWLFGESIVKFMAVSFNLRDIFFLEMAEKIMAILFFQSQK